MKNLLFYSTVLLSACLIFASCGNKTAQQTDPGNTTTTVKEKKPSKKDPKFKVLPITVDANSSLDISDNYNLYSAEIDEGYLKAIVSYSGGCKEHQFTMTTNGMWMKSMPPQLNLNLTHNANEDFCKAFIYDTLRFDLTNCINPAVTEVVLRVNSPSGKTEHITFQYEMEKTKK